MKVKDQRMKELAESDESSKSNESWYSSQGDDNEELATPLKQLDLV